MNNFLHLERLIGSLLNPPDEQIDHQTRDIWRQGMQMSAKLIPTPEAELAAAAGSAAPENEMTESIAAVTVLS